MAPAAQQDHIVDVGGTVGRPMHDVVRLAPGGIGAAAHAPLIPGHQRHALGGTGGPFSHSDPQRLVAGVEYDLIRAPVMGSNWP